MSVEPLFEKAEKLRREGHTVMFVSVNGQVS